ncbi:MULTISPECIES: spore germination protein [Virgibacillus]|uniref:Spore germination protein GerPF n=2 Tax=Virgibacillus TaxID=84406 RepID=A0ABQ2DUW2_9BACI|nr:MULTISPECIES: spore germination protein [Virgibacillus]EQB35157.1 spore germination protein GerPF [Virgibacillus sp. CM-4]MYL42786.1 spore germination protein [Virgibacillus massiliensis]GGJ69412.1 putative spore germination protein GerPF [Virgibacillus kapii]CDQ40680.1 putative spore germination protein GerPF [Virgibacillus massiliensis]
MPAIVGPIKIVSVGGGVVNFGDSFYLSPKDTAKTNAGSGSLNTGDFICTNNGISSTNPFDPDGYDQNITANA